MASQELLRAFLQQASASGARTTVLHPLSWLVGILTSGCVIASIFDTPYWVPMMLGGLLCLSVFAFLMAYFFFSVKDPDALRSERYTLSKMALEKNLIGDSEKGLMPLDVEESPPSSNPAPMIESARE